jgi:nicotinamide phosphoribosyltransferase
MRQRLPAGHLLESGLYAPLEPNIMLNTDSYKPSHHLMLPPFLTRILCFFESRGWSDEAAPFLREAASMFGVPLERVEQVLLDRQERLAIKETVTVGLQMELKKYFCGPVVTEEKIEEAYEVLAMHFDNSRIFNRKGWEYILKEYGGNLPLEIRAVPEGTVMPLKNVLFTSANTDPNVPWLPGYVEAPLVRGWYPTTVASQGRYIRQVIMRYLEETGTPALIDSRFHSFAARGVSSQESAGIGDAAHLVHSQGTDTLEGIRVVRAYYAERMAGYSIPASEHGVITPWGRESEADALSHQIAVFPKGPTACISDSNDIFACCRDIWGGLLREQVLQRDGVTIIRPDSGDPIPVLLKVLEILSERFGYTENKKNYKVLNDKVRIIQGDGIDRFTVGQILEALKLAGWSADNLAFGSGGGLLQKINRDTLKFAMKCCAAEFNGVWNRQQGWIQEGEWRGVSKNPITDPGKKSKEGLLVLRRDGESYRTDRVISYADLAVGNEMPVKFLNGRLEIDETLADIRARAYAA